jgi:hypothetical protein
VASEVIDTREGPPTRGTLKKTLARRLRIFLLLHLLLLRLLW